MPGRGAAAGSSSITSGAGSGTRPIWTGNETTKSQCMTGGRACWDGRSSIASSKEERYREAATLAAQVEQRSRHPMLFSFEKMALRDAIRSEAGPGSSRPRIQRVPPRRGPPEGTLPRVRPRSRWSSTPADPGSHLAAAHRLRIHRPAAPGDVRQAPDPETRRRGLWVRAGVRLPAGLDHLCLRAAVRRAGPPRRGGPWPTRHNRSFNRSSGCSARGVRVNATARSESQGSPSVGVSRTSASAPCLPAMSPTMTRAIPASRCGRCSRTSIRSAARSSIQCDFRCGGMA